MRMLMLLGLFLLANLVAPARASATDAWWEICYSCETDDQFLQRALQIPSPYTLVYVSNPGINETRRFGRTIIVDDLWDTVNVTIRAFPEQMSAMENDVFNQTIQNSSVVFAPIDRAQLNGFAPSGVDSVVGDLQNGSLDTRVLTGLQAYLTALGYRGSASQVSSNVGVNIKIVSFNLQVQPGGSIRTSQLHVRIRYPNGSTVDVVLSPDFQTFSGLTVTDDEGNAIPVANPNDPVGTFVDPIPDREMVFNSADQSFIDRFRDAVSYRSSLACRTEISALRTVVICSRP